MKLLLLSMRRQKFPKLWAQHAGSKNLADETIGDELLEVSQIIAGGIKFRKHLTEYFGYKVKGEHASFFSRHCALPAHSIGLPKLPANDDWQLYPVVDAARLFSYRPKPGHAINVSWGGAETLKAEDEALRVKGEKPNLRGKEIDVYEYWTNAK